jgi:hypothetical protein
MIRRNAKKDADASQRRLLQGDHSDDELDYEADAEEFDLDEDEDFYVKEELKQRWPSILAAVLLLLVGTIFCVVALWSFYIGDWWYAFPALVVGLICFTPGGVHISFLDDLVAMIC